MSKPKTKVQILPQSWLDAVIPVLEEGDLQKITWTLTAEKDLPLVGLEMKQDAYQLCLAVLNTPSMLGEKVTGMIDQLDGSSCETWAFLCPHPLGGPKPLYAKIGLNSSGITINVFSMHIDRKGDLLKAVKAAKKKK